MLWDVITLNGSLNDINPSNLNIDELLEQNCASYEKAVTTNETLTECTREATLQLPPTITGFKI